MKTLIKIVKLIDGYELHRRIEGNATFRLEIETHHRNGLVTVRFY